MGRESSMQRRDEKCIFLFLEETTERPGCNRHVDVDSSHLPQDRTQ